MRNTNANHDFEIDNLEDGDSVHQRCIVIHGRYHPSMPTKHGDSIFISVRDIYGLAPFPLQSWQVADNRFKALVMLSPGVNTIFFRSSPDLNIAGPRHVITVDYTPLLQAPPLHLAIMVAKDSPFLIDCPPSKYGHHSTAHSSLEAAIAKLRMSAYMWQALTAEDMRAKGLGRRSFRLEEEWTADTVSKAFLNGLHNAALHQSGAMRSTAKVHIIRSDKTVAEIRDENAAQQNKRARTPNKIFDYFLSALKSHGAPFISSARPVVAGMILDSHYDSDRDLILGHAALGCHNPKGISLGMFGSHLTYSFPRFMEEVNACLTDDRDPGDTVGNDNGECRTMWEAASIGQGAFLHEVGHAFGAPHTTGIMARGYAQHYPRNFVSKTAYCAHTNSDGFVVVEGETENKARWDLKDALSFRVLPHFRLPGDPVLTSEELSFAPTVTLTESDSGEPQIELSSVAGLARITINDAPLPTPTPTNPLPRLTFTGPQILANPTLSRTSPVKLSLLGMNGKEKTVANIWKLFTSKTHIILPGTSHRLQKRSVTCSDLENSTSMDDKQFWEWSTLLTRKRPDGSIQRATKVDVRTGCILDGAYVYFGDERVNCGPRISSYRHGGDHEHTFGGHASEAIHIPADQEIVKVLVSRSENVLQGLTMVLGNGKKKGQLSGGGESYETCVLEAGPKERIVGFYGRSYWGECFDGLVEFGILTVEKGVDLPEVAYEMEELRNTDGGIDLDAQKPDGENEYEEESDYEDGDSQTDS